MPFDAQYNYSQTIPEFLSLILTFLLYKTRFKVTQDEF
jgi:hypothetical protein